MKHGITWKRPGIYALKSMDYWIMIQDTGVLKMLAVKLEF